MKLPPLNALKAFEASARTGSFVLAARELGVSAAAVSLQVHKLEGFVGRKLFNRSHNRIMLTDAGRAIYPATAGAFGAISSLTERLLEIDSKPRLVLSVLPSLAERWLAPRLGEFARVQPDVALEIRIEDDPLDLSKLRIDVRVTYGAGMYPEFRAVPLFEDDLTPMHAPGLSVPADASEDFLHLPDSQLIHVDWGEAYASTPRWSDWFEAAKSTRKPVISKGKRVAMPSMAIALAARGAGVALGHVKLAAQELASGLLIAPSSLRLPLGEPYCAIVARARARDPVVVALLDQLIEGAS